MERDAVTQWRATHHHFFGCKRLNAAIHASVTQWRQADCLVLGRVRAEGWPMNRTAKPAQSPCPALALPHCATAPPSRRQSWVTRGPSRCHSSEERSQEMTGGHSNPWQVPEHGRKWSHCLQEGTEHGLWGAGSLRTDSPLPTQMTQMTQIALSQAPLRAVAYLYSRSVPGGKQSRLQ